jgi:lysophospholipase L1-like esterase
MGQQEMKYLANIVLSLIIACPALVKAWPDPMRFQDAIDGFTAQDESAIPPFGAIVGTGSSSMRFWQTDDRFATDFAPLTVINRGFGGSVMHDVEVFLDDLVLRYQPRAVLLYEGDNDVAEDIPLDMILASYDRIQARLDAEAHPPRVYLLSVKPSLLRWSMWPAMQAVNAALKARAESHPRVTYIDVASPMLNEAGTPREDIFVEDGLHMNAKGYDLWRDAVTPIVLAKELEFEPKK